MQTYIDDKNETLGQTRIEPVKGARPSPPPADASPDDAPPPQPPVKKITVGGKNFDVLGHLKVSSGEADIYLIQSGSEKYVFKYYRYDVVPKTKVIKKIKKLSPEHVIRIVDFGTVPNGRFYEVQEYAKFGSLEGYLKAERRPDEKFVVSFIREINMCLREIHDNGVVHRDIKPANILIRTVEPLDLILTDFGISSIDDGSLRTTGRARTTIYSAPESLTGVVTRTLDFWGAGIILLEMLTGRHPFADMDEAAVMYSLSTRPVPFVSEVPARFADIVRGLLTRDPKLRWGCDSVDSWLAGGKPCVYFEESSSERREKSDRQKVRPYRFGGADYSGFADLVAAMAKKPREAYSEIRSRGFREYLARDIIDEKAVAALDGVLSDMSFSDAERFSYFVLRALPSAGFIYSGIAVTYASLIEICKKAFARETDDATSRAIIDLTVGGVLARYLQVAGGGDPEREILTRIASAASDIAPSLIARADLCARAVLASELQDFREILTANAKNLWKSRIVIGAVHPFATVAETEEAVRGLLGGMELPPARLAALSDPPVEAFVTEQGYVTFAAQLREKHDNFMRAMTPFKDALEKIQPDAKNFIDSAASGVVPFDRENYAKLKKTSQSLELAAGEARKFITDCEVQAEKDRAAEASKAVEHTSSMIFGEYSSVMVFFLLMVITAVILEIVFIQGGNELGNLIGGPGSNVAMFFIVFGRVAVFVGTLTLTNFFHNILVFFGPIIILYNLAGPFSGVALGAAIGTTLLILLRARYEFMRSPLMAWSDYWELIRSYGRFRRW